MENYSEVKVCPEDARCGVSEAMFPHVGKCCNTRMGTVGTEFTCACPGCLVLKLPIDSTSLEVVTFFECNRYRYSKRVKGSALLK